MKINPTNQTNQTNQTNRTNKTALLFFLSAITLAPVTGLAFEFDGALKGVKITDAAGVNQPPTAIINYSQTAEIFTFDASSSSDPDGKIVTHKWDLGDGTSTTGEIITHQYTSSGIFPVKLSIIDNNGAVALSQIEIESIVCPDSPTVKQPITSAAAQIGNFSNVYYRGTTFRGKESINLCSVDISMKRWSGDISTKNFYVEIYTLDSNNNLSTQIATSKPIAGTNIPAVCGMMSFSFDSPVTIKQNSAIVVHMDGTADSKNYAAVCYKSFNNLYSDGEFGTWDTNKSANKISTDGSDLTFNLYGAQ